MTEVNVTEPEVTWVKVNYLPNDTVFIFYVWATTRIGRGEVKVLTEHTLSVDCELSGGGCYKGSGEAWSPKFELLGHKAWLGGVVVRASD